MVKFDQLESMQVPPPFFPVNKVASKSGWGVFFVEKKKLFLLSSYIFNFFAIV